MKFITVTEYAKKYNKSRQGVYNLIGNKRIPPENVVIVPVEKTIIKIKDEAPK